LIEIPLQQTGSWKDSDLSDDEDCGSGSRGHLDRHAVLSEYSVPHTKSLPYTVSCCGITHRASDTVSDSVTSGITYGSTHAVPNTVPNGVTDRVADDGLTHGITYDSTYASTHAVPNTVPNGVTDRVADDGLTLGLTLDVPDNRADFVSHRLSIVSDCVADNIGADCTHHGADAPNFCGDIRPAGRRVRRHTQRQLLHRRTFQLRKQRAMHRHRFATHLPHRLQLFDRRGVRLLFRLSPRHLGHR
jgi:hypothetical protein